MSPFFLVKTPTSQFVVRCKVIPGMVICGDGWQPGVVCDMNDAAQIGYDGREFFAEMLAYNVNEGAGIDVPMRVVTELDGQTIEYTYQPGDGSSHELLYYVDNGNPEQPISGVPVTDSGEPMDGLYDLLDEYSDTDVVIPFEHAVMARYTELTQVPQSIGGLDPVCTHIYTWRIPGDSRIIRYWFQPYTRD